MKTIYIALLLSLVIALLISKRRQARKLKRYISELNDKNVQLMEDHNKLIEINKRLCSMSLEQTKEFEELTQSFKSTEDDIFTTLKKVETLIEGNICSNE